jgi:hypothetical protein
MEFDFPINLSERKGSQIWPNDSNQINQLNELSQNEDPIDFMNQQVDSDHESEGTTVSMISLFSLNS